jgi:hypothetical protein
MNTLPEQLGFLADYLQNVWFVTAEETLGDAHRTAPLAGCRSCQGCKWAWGFWPSRGPDGSSRGYWLLVVELVGSPGVHADLCDLELALRAGHLASFGLP